MNTLEVKEVGAPVNGVPQTSERRLFLQFQAFTGCQDLAAVQRLMEQRQVDGVLYVDVNDPTGIGVLLMAERPEWLTQEGRALLSSAPFSTMQRRAALTMLGRTYASGREADLEDWLLKKPRRTALNHQWPWAIWYPLRRKPEFAMLPREEQGKILADHAKIGMAFGQAGFAADIRLACHGLDVNDNEFILGIVGPELYYLSALVQEMRKSQQTAQYIQPMGPFFIGRVQWQSPLTGTA